MLIALAFLVLTVMLLVCCLWIRTDSTLFLNCKSLLETKVPLHPPRSPIEILSEEPNSNDADIDDAFLNALGVLHHSPNIAFDAEMTDQVIEEIEAMNDKSIDLDASKRRRCIWPMLPQPLMLLSNYVLPQELVFLCFYVLPLLFLVGWTFSFAFSVVFFGLTLVGLC